ncbi:MAG: hypothetical protein PF450_10035 [Bacteroidales bacterium]|jgi:DNA-binding Lrp family transcriptional regulator|nr:hypothetical protein [Bacteroidales bacterium]
MSTKIVRLGVKRKKNLHKVDVKVIKFTQQKLIAGNEYYFQCNPMIVKRALDEDWLSALALYFKAKRLHVNSTIYNYSTSKLSTHLSRDPRTVARDIRKLLQLGLATRVGTNLSLISRKHLDALLGVDELLEENINGDVSKYKKLKWTICINKLDSIRKIEDKLIYKLIEFYALKQVIIGKDKLDIRKLHDPKGTGVSLKRLKHLKKKYGDITYKDVQEYERAVWTEDKITFGYRRLAEYLGLSVMKTWRIVKRLQSYGMLLAMNDEFYLDGVGGKPLKLSKDQLKLAREGFWMAYRGYAFVNKKGEVKIRRASTYNFYEYEVQIGEKSSENAIRLSA